MVHVSSTEVVHLRHSDFDIYIGRKTRGGQHHYGNPFKIGEDGTREEVIEAYRLWLEGTAYQDVEPERRAWILTNLYKLKGKRLGCYCSPLPCHGDVLKEIVDGA